MGSICSEKMFFDFLNEGQLTAQEGMQSWIIASVRIKMHKYTSSLTLKLYQHYVVLLSIIIIINRRWKTVSSC